MTTTKTPVYLSVLMAGLLSAGAYAQSTSAAGSSDLPPKAGEASTQTMGAPNAQTTNSTASEKPAMSKDEVRQDAQGRNTASATSSVPVKAGEASTSVAGKPNALPAPQAKTRAEVKAELAAGRADYQSSIHDKSAMKAEKKAAKAEKTGAYAAPSSSTTMGASADTATSAPSSTPGAVAPAGGAAAGGATK